MGDRIAVIKQGEVLQVGTPEDIFRRPRSEFVARFLMARNVFRGEVTDGDGNQPVLSADGIKMKVNTGKRGEVQASIRPEDIHILTGQPPENGHNAFEGQISRISDRGSVIYVTVDIPPQFTCMILRRSFREMDLKEGQKAFVTFAAPDVNLF
jgi:ABC-type Fe3+/spermidine/putrescine transport system ATPase subunit